MESAGNVVATTAIEIDNITNRITRVADNAPVNSVADALPQAAPTPNPVIVDIETDHPVEMADSVYASPRPRGVLSCKTDQGTPVATGAFPRPLTPMEVNGFISDEDKLGRDRGCPLVRVENPTTSYNCWGFTFLPPTTRSGAGAWIQHPLDVANIINHNGYVEISAQEAQPLDVVVYIDDCGVITHTGLVMNSSPNNPIPTIRSKWGPGSLLDHPADCVPSDYLQAPDEAGQRRCDGVGAIRYFRKMGGYCNLSDPAYALNNNTVFCEVLPN
jgi:hypothetical protein